MNQNPSHSQTPQFDANKSQTSQRLYQHPTAVEMRTSFWCRAKALGREVLAIAVIVSCIASPVFVIRSCSDDVNRQHAQAVKHQLQFSASNGGAR